MAQKLNELALSYATAMISAAGVLLLGIFGNLGVYTGASQLMMQGHMFFSLGIAGIITGMIEAAVWGFIGGWLIAYVYNRFA